MSETPPIINPDDVPADHRSGYVAIIGKPNVGKSTLLNALLGRKLAIVTPKPQTTRHRILGIRSDERAQIIFLDTPGIIKPRYRLQEAMMRDVAGAIRDADLLLFMADATRDRPDTFSLEHLGDRPALLVLNKMDLIRQEEALPLVKAYTELRSFEEVIPISALQGTNLDRLLEAIIARLPVGPPFYPRDMLSEHPERFFIAEIIREKIFQQYRDEIPYSTQVNIVTYQERPEGKDFIDAEIVVERDTQKAILIGKGGRALKRVGQAAREDIEAFLGKPVYLQLHVKVRADWRNTDTYLRAYGYQP
ncbi:MAG: GTPase Era [Rhodothermaceae bacterium]|nr:MAG: GTPase Era [Rhodothermaceae bacterium]